MIAVSAPHAVAILCEQRAILGARRHIVEHMLASDDAIACIVAGAALRRLLEEELANERAIGAVWLSSRLQDLAWVARMSERPGSLDDRPLLGRP